MATQDFEALARRCEQATGPDRELDVRIHCLVRGVEFPEPPYEGEYIDYDEIPYGGVVKVVPTKNGLLLPSRKDSALRYTASLDAAMTLVPEGCNWCIDTREGPPAANVGGMWVEGRTPALALCAASLRARA